MLSRFPLVPFAPDGGYFHRMNLEGAQSSLTDGLRLCYFIKRFSAAVMSKGNVKSVGITLKKRNAIWR